MSHSHEQSCADFIERIVYFLDNELHEDDITEVRVHLDRCGPCLQTYDLQKTLKALVARSCSEPAPEDLRRRVLFSVRQVQIHISEG